eukprot:gene11878-13112_t
MSFDEHWDPNMLIDCPFNNAHRIAACRFQRHIVKCRKRYPMMDTVTCPYNACHVVLRSNFRVHLGNCPNRTVIEPDVVQSICEETGETFKLMGNVSLPETTWRPPNQDEDWDKEAEEYQQNPFSSQSSTNSKDLRTDHCNARLKKNHSPLRQPHGLTSKVVATTNQNHVVATANQNL